MGATVVDTSVTLGTVQQKPEGYDSKDFDKAIKAYEGLTAKCPWSLRHFRPCRPRA